MQPRRNRASMGALLLVLAETRPKNFASLVGPTPRQGRAILVATARTVSALTSLRRSLNVRSLSLPQHALGLRYGPTCVVDILLSRDNALFPARTSAAERAPLSYRSFRAAASS